MSYLIRLFISENKNSRTAACNSTQKELADLCLNDALVYVKIRSVKVALTALLKVFILFFVDDVLA